jgi:hypothetical protein
MELVALCKAMENTPTDYDEVFVIGINHKVSHGKLKNLRIVFSTLRLLEYAKKNRLIATDGTYKLIWQGLPCSLTGIYLLNYFNINYNHKIIYKGTVDMCKKFHPLCFMVTKHEKAKDYAYMFSCLQIAVSKHFDFEYEPDTLLGDSAAAITNGFTIGFQREPTYRIICWAHCLRKFDEIYTFPIKNEKTKEAVRADLFTLQTSQSPEIFKIGRQLYLCKWSKNNQVIKCLNDFFKVWGKVETENWYERYHPDGCVPSTDNALESSNGQVKSQETLRERLPIGQFVNSVKNRVLKDFSSTVKVSFLARERDLSYRTVPLRTVPSHFVP